MFRLDSASHWGVDATVLHPAKIRAYLSQKYGNWRGDYNRLRMWAVDGTWERVFTALMAQADVDGDLARAVSVDSTIVPAHQHTAGPAKGGARPARPTLATWRRARRNRSR
jgi:transposase